MFNRILLSLLVLLLSAGPSQAVTYCKRFPTDTAVACYGPDYPPPGGGSVTNVATSAPITGGPITTTGTIGITQSNTSIDGYLSSTDWNTFNGKQNSLTIGNLTDAGTDGIVVTNGLGSVIGTGTSFAQHVSDVSHNGYLSSTDWSTFNSKGTGSVTSVATNATLTGGPITTTGTLGINLSNANTWAATQTIPTVNFGSSTGASGTATSGVLTLGGIGNTNNENLQFDFEGSANKVAINSGSGVNTISFITSAVTLRNASSSTGGTGMVTLGGTASASSEALGFNGTVTNSSSNAAAAATGGRFIGLKTGTGTSTDLTIIGSDSQGNFNSTGTQSTAYGAYGKVSNLTTGTITDGYSIFGATPVNSGGGTITNSWAGGFAGNVKITGNLNLTGLSASSAVFTDANKNLTTSGSVSSFYKAMVVSVDMTNFGGL